MSEALRPDISIVIPTFNRVGLLVKAIESVLVQDAPSFEVVISDNASTDETESVVRRYCADPRVRYWRNESNLGMVGNWRKAIFERTRADWFVLLSDDDYFTDFTYIRRVCEAIRQHKPVLVFAGGHVCWSPSMKTETLRLPFDGLVCGREVFANHGVLRPQEFILANVAFPRAAALRLGFLNNERNLSCDSELFLKLCLEGEVYAIPDPVCVYLRHDGNLILQSVTNHEFRDHNLDHLINPYIYAKELGLDKSRLELFLANVDFEKKLRNSLLLLKLHNHSWYDTCRTRIKRQIPEELNRIERSWKTRLLWMILWTFRPWFKRRYPMT